MCIRDSYYIDTYTKDLENYIVYGRNNISSGTFFSCLNPDEEIAPRLLETSSVAANDGRFRQYRLAMACTIEYAAYHINAAGVGAGTLAQRKAAVLAAMNVTMTRVNGLYERDMSLRMNLVANNDLVIFVTSDNFDNDTSTILIDQSQVEIDAAIGSANYDIGHTVSTGGGGLAQLNSPCTSNKARGITGSPAPVGDPFDIDYVAHEMGHQFGATHTQNNNCNRSAGTAVETGSGNTIMGYAGICAPDVQSNSDAHFHTVSLNQMMTFTTSTGNCAPNALNGNTPPAVNAGVDRTIPKGTPFILFPQSVTDANGLSLIHIWSINAWSLNLCNIAPALAVNQNIFENFALYPNPNNGTFTVQFNSSSNNSILIGIHDIRGREVFSKTYLNNGFFNEKLQLDNLQSGVYLINIQEGDKKITKKIVIE